MTDTHLNHSNQRIILKHSFNNAKQFLIEQKRCVLCDEEINIDDYVEHVDMCTGPEKILSDALVQPIDDPDLYFQPVTDVDEDTNDEVNTPERRSSITVRRFFSYELLKINIYIFNHH